MEPLPIDPEKLLTHIVDLLKFSFGSKIQIAHQIVLLSKHDYVVMHVKTIHPTHELILKLAGPDAPLRCPFEQSAFLHRLIATQTSLRIPEVFAADTSCQRWLWRYLIRSAASGVEWAKVRDGLDVEEVATLHAQLGDAVAQLHNISFPAFGELAIDGVIRGGVSSIEALRERASLTIAHPHLLTQFLSLLDRNIDLFIDVDRAVLCHEDLHRHNILVEKKSNRWQISTILDFDKAWAGHAESDLARLELWDGMSSQAFWQAYRTRRDLSPLYEARRPIYQLLWCLEYAKPSAKHLADTNRLGRPLGLPLIERFD